MGVRVSFDRSDALAAGVVFIPVFEPDYDPDAPLVQIGEDIITPDGVTGFSILPDIFQCKIVNQELKAWFLAHVKSAEVSYL
jgi:hypothetical protein